MYFQTDPSDSDWDIKNSPIFPLARESDHYEFYWEVKDLSNNYGALCVERRIPKVGAEKTPERFVFISSIVSAEPDIFYFPDDINPLEFITENRFRIEINPFAHARYSIPGGITKAAIEIPDLEQGILPALPSRNDEALYDVYSAFPKGPLVGKYIAGNREFFAKQSCRSKALLLEEAQEIVGTSLSGSVVGLIGNDNEQVPALWRKISPKPIELIKPSSTESSTQAPLGVNSDTIEFVVGIGRDDNQRIVEGIYWQLSECHMSVKVEAAGPLEDFCDSAPWLRRIPERMCQGGFIIARTNEGREVLKHK